jgi:aspartyl-tRNA(Asn)/glutamyl-tRNA(Gln) amidotransferase subunit B
LRAIANLLINEVLAILRAEKLNDLLGPEHDLAKAELHTFDNLKFTVQDFLALVNLLENKTISTSAMKLVLAEMVKNGGSPAAIVQGKGLAQVSDTSAIEKFCDDAIAANPGPVTDFKSGKAAALNFLKGQVMKLSKGKANPALAGEILEKKLKN